MLKTEKFVSIEPTKAKVKTEMMIDGSQEDDL